MNDTDTQDIGDRALLASVFEERAEYLSKTELNAWTQETPRAREIIAKLKGPGAKLLSGPRGCGKSTFLRKAYFDLLESGDTLAVYINYARSLALEPLFHHRANAIQVFRQWVLAKILVGVHKSYSTLWKTIPPELESYNITSHSLIRDLETGVFEDLPDNLVSPTELLLLLENWTKEHGFRRCVLLMDDAAHAFSPDQQREFFEIFRLLRSRVVAAKAAVYPGITSYSPHFHVGHEAELIEAWHQPDDQDYLSTMKSMVARRLPADLYKDLSAKSELIDYLALASFGLPRGFLNMIQELLVVEEAGVRSRASRAEAEDAVRNHVESVRGIFLSLKNKLPRFRNFVTVGLDVERAMSAALRRYNQDKELGQKAVVVAVSEPLEKELERIMSLLEYAGLVRPLDKVSRGIKGVFRRYVVHFAVVLSENALNLGKSYPMTAAVTALSRRDAHAFVRVRGSALLGDAFESRCQIDLPPCQRCKTPRLAMEQRFCMKCGAQLADTSIYADLIRAPIDRLPLTSRKIQDLHAHSAIRTVQDILLDEDMQQIRGVPDVGPVWASRIRNAAEEFVSV
jgi:hypothetical protein